VNSDLPETAKGREMTDNIVCEACNKDMSEHVRCHCPFEAMWRSPSGSDYRKIDGKWRHFIGPGVRWQASMTVPPLTAEMLDAITTPGAPMRRLTLDRERTEMSEQTLPELPPLPPYNCSPYDDEPPIEEAWYENEMRSYGAECARLERERAAKDMPDTSEEIASRFTFLRKVVADRLEGLDKIEVMRALGWLEADLAAIRAERT
jgi:hypothetical protein